MDRIGISPALRNLHKSVEDNIDLYHADSQFLLTSLYGGPYAKAGLKCANLITLPKREGTCLKFAEQAFFGSKLGIA
jgi:hypothetical protein